MNFGTNINPAFVAWLGKQPGNVQTAVQSQWAALTQSCATSGTVPEINDQFGVPIKQQPVAPTTRAMQAGQAPPAAIVGSSALYPLQTALIRFAADNYGYVM